MADQEINTTEEIWKAIPGWPGYDVSNRGRVRSYWRKTKPTGCGYEPGWVMDDNPQRILKGSHTKEGYPNVHLKGTGGHIFRIHQLVLIAFVGPCPPDMEACHEDGNTENCFLENLRWDTPANNALDKRRHGTIPRGEDASRGKLKTEQVLKIRELASQGYGYRQLGRMFSVGHHAICCIIHRRSWTHI